MKHLRKMAALISVLVLTLVLAACDANGGDSAASLGGADTTSEATNETAGEATTEETAETTKGELSGRPWV